MSIQMKIAQEVPLNGCSGKCVGETIRTMAIRMREHTRHTQNGRVDLSDISEYEVVQCHGVDWASENDVDEI